MNILPTVAPKTQRRIYLGLAAFFAVDAFFSFFLGYQENVGYVSKLSEVALIGAALACYQAVRGEVKQDEIIRATPGAEDPS